VSIFTEPKIDCHNHVLDPQRFEYSKQAAYWPAGQEIGTQAQHLSVMNAYGIHHALIVGPNSGYGTDNRCLLDTVQRSAGRFKGIAVVDLETSAQDLAALKAQGIVGIALNATVQGVAYCMGALPLMQRCEQLGLFVQIQVEADQMVALGPTLLQSGAQLLVDHCGRPVVSAGLSQPGFQALLALAKSGRCKVKLSGWQKFAQKQDMSDVQAFVYTLVDAFSLDNCVWASDWPFLKASQRVDIGPLLCTLERWFPHTEDRRRFLWQTPVRLFGFDGKAHSSAP
jgi:predicted TIM-barrel fold metal-dependent hydrolase